MAKISVVMASFNHEQFVAEAIESVLDQSFQDFEFLITDDGSSDGTQELVRRFAELDSRIKFVAFPENRGACVALNDAISRSEGEYVAVLNSDDRFLPGKLARQLGYLDARPQLAAVFALPCFIDEEGQKIWSDCSGMSAAFEAHEMTSDQWLRHFFMNGNCLCHPTLMIRRSCYEDLGVLDISMRQLPDLDFWVRLSARYEFHVLPEVLTEFRLLRSERNASSPSEANIARAGWEMLWLLQTYLTLDPERLRRIFQADFPSGSDGIHPHVLLGRLALKIPQSGHISFGLKVLRDRIKDGDPAIAAKEYFDLVGSSDPFGAVARREQRVVAAIRMRWVIGLSIGVRNRVRSIVGKVRHLVREK